MTIAQTGKAGEAKVGERAVSGVPSFQTSVDGSKAQPVKIGGQRYSNVPWLGGARSKLLIDH